MDTPYQLPDLQSVLQTLAAFTAPQTQQQQSYQQPHSPHPQPPSHDPRISATSAPTAPTAPTPPPPAPEVKTINPATITDWSTALKCVMRTVAANETIIKDIRRMIRTEHSHSAQWFAGRLALLQKQAAREEGQKKLDEVIKAVGGTVLPSSTGLTALAPIDPVDELRVYDMKVWKAQAQMVTEFSQRLKALGVPFFGVPSGMVRRRGEAPSTPGAGDGKGEGTTEGKRIGEEELVALQRRMVDLLRDLVGGEEEEG